MRALVTNLQSADGELSMLTAKTCSVLTPILVAPFRFGTDLRYRQRFEGTAAGVTVAVLVCPVGEYLEYARRKVKRLARWLVLTPSFSLRAFRRPLPVSTAA